MSHQRPKAFGERQSHAYAGSRQQPNTAKATNPIDGSNLYHEGEGRIVNLVSPFDPTGVLQRPALANGLTVFRIVGHTFAVNDLQTAGQTVSLQFFKNAIAVTDPIVLNRFFEFIQFQPVSPFAGPVTVTPQATAFNSLPPFTPIFRIEFDEIRVTCVGAGVILNGWIAQGRARIDYAG